METACPGAVAGSPDNYLAARAGGGWSSQSITPPQAVKDPVSFPTVGAYSPDLAKAAFADGGGNNLEQLGQDSPPLVAGEPQNILNAFLRDNATGTYQLMNLTPSGVTPSQALFQGASADFSHLLFASDAPLIPGAPDGEASQKENLYEWVDGALSLAGQIPTAPAVRCGVGGPACSASVEGAALGNGSIATAPGGLLNAVSSDGSKVFFKDAGSFGFEAQLYVRENGATTVEISASQKTNGLGPGGTDPAGPQVPRYWPASADGSKAFFTSCEQLTDDSTANASESSGVCLGAGAGWKGSDLYQYDTASDTLSDLTVDHNGDPFGADVQTVLGASTDGSYVYFVANGVLASGASLGDCNGAGEPGQCNVYVSHNGTTTFIARIDGAGQFDRWSEFATTARVTPDGTRLAFETQSSLTGYDNRDAASGEPDGEVYLYDASSHLLQCVSCNPDGARPIGSSHLAPVEEGPSASGSRRFEYLPRNLSSDGARLFFDSADALVPGDVNAKQDVYEYEDGSLHLVSNGTSSEASMFVDASLSGNDVFFTTRSQLVGQDLDRKIDIYDARVGGGLLFAGSPVGCVGEACRPLPSVAPGVASVGSGVLLGGGNLAPVLAPSPPIKPRGKPVTRAQKLAAALKLCRRAHGQRRASCVRRARRHYGVAKAAGKSTKSVRGGK